VNTSYAASATAAMTTAAAGRRLNQNGPRAGRSNARLIEGTDRVWTNITKTHRQPYHHYRSTTTVLLHCHCYFSFVIADNRRPCDRADDFDVAATQRPNDAKRIAPLYYYYYYYYYYECTVTVDRSLTKCSGWLRPSLYPFYADVRIIGAYLETMSIIFFVRNVHLFFSTFLIFRLETSNTNTFPAFEYHTNKNNNSSRIIIRVKFSKFCVIYYIMFVIFTEHHFKHFTCTGHCSNKHLLYT